MVTAVILVFIGVDAIVDFYHILSRFRCGRGVWHSDHYTLVINAQVNHQRGKTGSATNLLSGVNLPVKAPAAHACGRFRQHVCTVNIKL